MLRRQGELVYSWIRSVHFHDSVLGPVDLPRNVQRFAQGFEVCPTQCSRVDLRHGVHSGDAACQPGGVASRRQPWAICLDALCFHEAAQIRFLREQDVRVDRTRSHCGPCVGHAPGV